jgi:hypothetical protein
VYNNDVDKVTIEQMCNNKNNIIARSRLTKNSIEKCIGAKLVELVTYMIGKCIMYMAYDSLARNLNTWSDKNQLIGPENISSKYYFIILLATRPGFTRAILNARNKHINVALEPCYLLKKVHQN